MVKNTKSFTLELLAVLLMFIVISIPISFAEQLSLVYDGNGNLISGDGKTRIYNEFNQLIRVNDSVTGKILETYIYHPTDDRILVKKTNPDATGSSFDDVSLYFNDNFIRQHIRIQGNDEIKDIYYAKDDNGIVGEVSYNTSQLNGSFALIGKKFYHNDHLGSTSVITNESGAIVEETFYDPYGAILGGGQVSRYQYEGKEFSEVTEDYDFNFRKYNPELGIFTQPEQTFPNVYDPQQLNRYRFERNNPYKYVDPDGKNPLAIIGIAGGIGLVVGVGFYALEAYSGDLSFSWKGLGSYALGGTITGAASGIIVAYAVTTIPAIGIGATSATVSKIITNYGTDQSLSKGIVGGTIIGGGTVGFGEFFPATRGLKNIKYFESYFTKKSGQQFISNIFASEVISSSIPTNLPQQYYNQNLAQNPYIGGCNPTYQSCVPSSGSSSSDTSSGRSNIGSSRKIGETITGGGVCGVTASCE